MSIKALKMTVAAAAVGLAFAGPAKAAAVEVWSITDALSGPGFAVKSYLIGNSLVAGDYVGSISDVSAFPFSNFANLGIAIYKTGVAGPALESQFFMSPASNHPYSFDFTVASPGSYTALVFGQPGTNGLANASAFAASISLVPEAETWAMMAVGLGLLGWQLRRKVRSTDATRLV